MSIEISHAEKLANSWKQEDLAIKDRKARIIECLKTTLTIGPTFGRDSILSRSERSVVQRIFQHEGAGYTKERVIKILESLDTTCLDDLELIDLDVDRDEVEEEDFTTGFCHKDIDGNYLDGLKPLYKEYFHLWKSVQREKERWVEKYPEFLFHVLIFDSSLLNKRSSRNVRRFMSLYRQIIIIYETDQDAASNGLSVIRDRYSCIEGKHRLRQQRAKSVNLSKPNKFIRYVFVGKGLLKPTKLGEKYASNNTV